MTYNKPNDKTYTEMCMYFDKHIYDDPEIRNDELLYQYLYHIVYMLACKKNFFHGPNSWDNYDEFALYAATKIYTRYINPKHADDPDLKLKSVLNYCKALLYPMKVDWQKETFNEIIGKQDDDEESLHELKTTLEGSVQASYCDNEELIKDVILVFEHLGDITRKVIDRTPYTSSPILRKRLIMSVVMTILNQATLPTNILNKEGELEYKYTLLKKLRNSDIILWRLDSMYHNLVHVLAAEVKKECSTLVGTVRADYELPDEDVTSILMTAYGNVARDDNEEF